MFFYYQSTKFIALQVTFAYISENVTSHAIEINRMVIRSLYEHEEICSANAALKSRFEARLSNSLNGRVHYDNAVDSVSIL